MSLRSWLALEFGGAWIKFRIIIDLIIISYDLGNFPCTCDLEISHSCNILRTNVWATSQLIIIISIIITSIFLLFLYQLEEHVTYLVCEVELNKKKKKKKKVEWLRFCPTTV